MQEKLLSLIAEFNHKGRPEPLVFIFAQSVKNTSELVEFVNINAKHEKLNALKFSVLKLTADHLIYINKIGKITRKDTGISSLELILNEVKAQDREKDASIDIGEIRSLLLLAGKGVLKSYDVYTNIDTNIISKEEVRRSFMDKGIWTNERACLHNEIVESFIKKVRYLSCQINESEKIENGLYCVRGSVASGKTTFAKRFLQNNLSKTGQVSGIINTDDIKRLLMRKTINLCGINPSGYLFHDEASMISELVLAKARDENLLYFVDKRMQQDKDLGELLTDAENRKLPVTIFDIRVDFMTSVLRVLSRTGAYPSDPTPDFKGLFKSYKEIEASRERFFQEAMQSPWVKKCYSVLFTNSEAPILIPLKDNYKVIRDKDSLAAIQSNLINEEDFENVLLSSGKTVRESLDNHSKKIHENKISKEGYRDALFENIKNTSRTYDGKLDVSASADKKNKMNVGLSAKSVRLIVKDNIENTFEFIYDNRNLIINNAIVLKKIYR